MNTFQSFTIDTTRNHNNLIIHCTHCKRFIIPIRAGTDVARIIQLINDHVDRDHK